jgi:hypothetical protein
MSKRGARQLVFVCSSISGNGELISKMVPAKTPDEASSLFLTQNSVAAQIVLGPFYKKSTQVLETVRSLKFAKGKAKRAIFNDWVVNAFALSEPADQAYLVFIKRVDEKKLPAPKGTITAPLSSLRFLDE